MILVDTNIICRYLLKDNPSQYKQANSILNRSDIYIDTLVIAEIIWVLIKFYKLDKQTVIDKISALINLPNIVHPQKLLMLQTLDNYSKNNISLVDSWLLTLHQNTHNQLITFDHTLSKLSQ